MMDLLLQTTGQAPGGRNSAPGKQLEVAASSDFSRLLANQPQGLTEGRRDNEVSPDNDRKQTVKERPGDETARGTERLSGVPSDQKEQGSPATIFSDAEGYSTDPPLTGILISGFPAPVDPLGLLNFSGTNDSGMEFIPADARARLAGQIAANFTNRNGMQTLTLQLEPEHLGKVEVRLVARGNQLSIRLLAENREAETALRHNLKELTDGIQERTGKYQQVEVRVELKSQDESGQKNTDQKTPQDDSRQPAGQDSQGSWRGDPETEDTGNTPAGNDPETSPEQWAQGG